MLIYSTLASKLGNAITLADVLLLLCTNYSCYSSLFNIQLFKDIVEIFGDDDDRRKMEAYEEDDLIPYLQQHLKYHQNPLVHVMKQQMSFTWAYIYLMMIFQQGSMWQLSDNLSRLLGIQERILRFIGYETGSTIVIFGIPKTLLHKGVVYIQNITDKCFTLDTMKIIYGFCGDLALHYCK